MILRQAKRLVILVIGATVMALGVAMLVLPGPGIVVVLAGLGILATEFVWARHWLRKAQEGATNGYSGIKSSLRFFKRRPADRKDQ